MKLALGTAQFGLAYGIANARGQVSADEGRRILECGESAGMDTLDTAMAYGDSEQRLGQIGVGRWQVVSKLPAVPDRCPDVSQWVVDAVHQSLQRLRTPHLDGLLLHRPDQLLGDQGPRLYAAMEQLRDQGVVKKIGVSIYVPAELDTLCAAYRFDLVQAPFNLLDRRLVDSGWLHRLVAVGTEVHVRSVFLQGLLLMAPADRPPAFGRWAPLWTALDQWLEQTGLTPLQACLRDAMAVPEISKVIVGVDSLRHLAEILAAATGPAPPPAGLGTNDPELINPGRWNTSKAE